MRAAESFRAVLFGILACAMAWETFLRFDTDIGTEREGRSLFRQRYMPLISGALLPSMLLLIVLLAILLGELRAAAISLLAPLISTLFLQSSLYYALLLSAMPFLRKWISARTCAVLWLLPTYLYYIFLAAMELTVPRWVIRVPMKAGWILFGIWSAGFAAIMVWKLMEHLSFRRTILQEAREVHDPAICRIMDDVIEEVRIKRPKFKLVRSPHVRTPVSIGLFQRTMRVVLPIRAYTPEELKLILRHEIIHIAREDAWAKFFMAFCTAMFWFNPLMWIAMRKSAEDIELSCDETVLLEANNQMRKQYGVLLLETAADERGFTTCLSASAQAMRYRLTNIIKPQKRRSGALVLGILLFALCMTGGYTALAYGNISGTEAIYSGRDPVACTFRVIEKEEGVGMEDREYTAVDPLALHAYLAGLELAEVMGNYSFEENGTVFEFFIDKPEGGVEVILRDHYVTVAEQRELRAYYVHEGIDWELVLQTVEPMPWYKN